MALVIATSLSASMFTPACLSAADLHVRSSVYYVVCKLSTYSITVNNSMTYITTCMIENSADLAFLAGLYLEAKTIYNSHIFMKFQ